MLLAIDIGNSDMTLGIYSSGSWNPVWRIPSVTDLPLMYYSLRIVNHFLEGGIATEEISQIVISSVVPELTDKIQDTITSIFHKTPVIMGPEVYSKLTIRILNPYEIGADLVANALAAYTRFQSNCVVVDFGTALTFTTVSSAGEILGVSIAPGLKTAIKSLSQNTARLFDVPMEVPKSVLGKSTTHAIQAGVMIGYEGMVIHMLNRIKAELSDPDLKSVATGGLSMTIPSLRSVFTDVDPYLTLAGLRIVASLGKDN